MSYTGADLESIMSGSIDSCCKACGAKAGCKAWSYCNLPAGQRCGTKAAPVDCYLKVSARPLANESFSPGCVLTTDGAVLQSAAANPSRGGGVDSQRVSGSPGAGCRPSYGPPPPPPPAANDNWRFFNLLENGEAVTLARLPDFGSGYLKDLNCTNSDTKLTCPVSRTMIAGIWVAFFQEHLGPAFFQGRQQ